MSAADRRRVAVGTGALVALALLAYAPTLGNAFVWDDVAHIATNPRLDSLTAAASYFGGAEGRYYRPFVFVSYACEHRLWGASPLAAHLVNMLLHAGNAALVVLAGRRGGLSVCTALTGAAVFALHPVQSEAVAYISGRTDLLMTGAALLSVIALLGKGSPIGRGVAVAVAGAVAMLSKESGFAVVAVWAFVAWRRLATWRERAVVVGPGLLTAAALLALRPAAALPAPPSCPTLTQLGGAGWALLRYALLLVWPVGLQVDRLTPLPAGRVAITVGLFALAAVLAVVVHGLARPGVVAEWTAWAAAFYLPAANLVAIYPDIASAALFTPEHNLYAPLAGLGILSAVAGQRSLAAAPMSWRRAAATVGLVTLLVWAALTAVRSGAWHDEERLFGAAAAAGSRSPRVWMNYGNALLRRGALAAAAEAFDTGTRLAPGDAGLWMNLAVSHQKLGEVNAAENDYRRAAQLAPDDAQVWENLGTLYLASGARGAARQAFARALQLDPARTVARRGLDATGTAR